MIQIKLAKDKWRLVFEKETWEFDCRDSLIAIQKQIMDMKEQYGKLKEEDRY